MIAHGELRQEYAVDVALEESRRGFPLVGRNDDKMIAPVDQILLDLDLGCEGAGTAITTDGLRSYKAAMTELCNSDKQ